MILNDPQPPEVPLMVNNSDVQGPKKGSKLQKGHTRVQDAIIGLQSGRRQELVGALSLQSHLRS